MEIERKEVFVARGEILAVSVFLVYSSLIAPTSSGIVLLNQYLFTSEREARPPRDYYYEQFQF